MPRWADENVLVGFDTADDAGVYKLPPELALVQTVDFFTPIVDDPYTYGAIAAANALSDVYAMGGRPISALTILAWPPRQDPRELEEILKGGAEKMHEAGDALVFTKRIGTGVIATALKRGIARQEDVAASVASMLTLNRAACEEMLRCQVHGCTDVTGFGLIGHAREMALASQVTLEIAVDRLQFLPGAVEYARSGALPGGLKNNREFASCVVEAGRQLPPEIEALLYDPQTSGGLLISLSESDAAKFAGGYRIGRVLPRAEKAIRLI